MAGNAVKNEVKRSKRNLWANRLTVIETVFENVDWSKSSIHDMACGAVSTHVTLSFSSYVYNEGRVETIRTSIPNLKVEVEIKTVMPASTTKGEIMVCAKVTKVEGRSEEPSVPKTANDFASVVFEDINIFNGTAIVVGAMLHIIVDIEHSSHGLYIGYVSDVLSVPELTKDELVFQCSAPLGTRLPANVDFYPVIASLTDASDDFTVDELIALDDDTVDQMFKLAVDTLAATNRAKTSTSAAKITAIMQQRFQPQSDDKSGQTDQNKS